MLMGRVSRRVLWSLHYCRGSDRTPRASLLPITEHPKRARTNIVAQSRRSGKQESLTIKVTGYRLQQNKSCFL